MQTGSAVVVRRAGFFTSIVRGVFGLMITSVVCVSALGLYGLHIFDRKGEHLFDFARSVGENLPEWQAALPPALSDALSDRRDVHYHDKLSVTTKVKADPARDLPHDRRRWLCEDENDTRVIVEITNNGEETVSLLALRLTMFDDDGDAIGDWAAYGATPLTLENRSWRGPLLPGATRVIVERPRHLGTIAKAKADVTEVRVWDPRVAEQARAEVRLQRAERTAIAAMQTDKSETTDTPPTSAAADRNRTREHRQPQPTVRADRETGGDENE